MNTSRETLIDPDHPSDAGGVSGRVGFRYQDHIGAGYVLDMLLDRALTQVEFETADDITLRWNADGRAAIEYVQVKTTEEDAKWSITEIATRDHSRPGTSLIEKSLTLDVNPGTALFRFVTRRDVNSSLRPFTVPRNNRRVVQPKIDAAVASIGKKFKTFKSKSGRSTRDWASNFLWVVAGTQPSVENENVNRIIRLSEQTGEVPSFSVAKEFYDLLMTWVQRAADASRVSDPDAKAISNEQASAWWRERVGEVRIRNRASVLVYRVSSETFFGDLHKVEDPYIFRSLSAYDVEFDEGTWRKVELIEYLLGWLPEISLPAKVLAEFDHLQARGLTVRAARRIGQSAAMDDSKVLADLMLHAVLRHYFDSEPIACKIYHGLGASKTSTSAHIVPVSTGDQLWIGRARITTATSHQEVVEAVIEEMGQALISALLREERDLILTLREPRHMRTTSLEKVLSPGGKIEDLRKCMRLPILIAYDSAVVAAGFAEGYVEALRDEALAQYEDLKARLSSSLAGVQVHVFLIPIDDPAGLATNFGRRLRGG